MTGDIDRRTRDVAETCGAGVIEQETDNDHIHILFSGKPTINLSRLIGRLKAVTAKVVRQEFPAVMKKYVWGGRFRSPSYFLASVGQVTLEDIRHYVETQEGK